MQMDGFFLIILYLCNMTQNSAKNMILKAILPVIIGIGVVIWLFKDEFSSDILNHISLNTQSIFALIFVWIFVFGRDFGLAWRFRILTNSDLTWLQSTKVTMLCEFTSAITPSSVGGSALSMIFLNREGINMGRATTLTMTTLFLDELFFVISCPIVVALVPYSDLFGFGNDSFTSGLKLSFWLIYIGITIWTIILFIGIIIKPILVKKLLTKLFSLKILKRWYANIDHLTDTMLETSTIIKQQSINWWIKASLATMISWLSRYLVVNVIFWGFAPYADQIIVLSRQFIVWAILMVSPTPGGSGLSEWLFSSYYGDLINSPEKESIILLIALTWRIISYYIYLIIGIFILPSFFKKKRK